MKSTAEIADMFRISEKTVRAWMRDGMPVAVPGAKGRGRAAQFSPEDCIRWYFNKHHVRLELQRARTRLAHEQADKLALENADRSADLVPLDVMQFEWEKLRDGLMAIALAVPDKLAPALEGMNVRECEVEIDRAMREMLTQMADYRPDRDTRAA